jgi:N-acetylglucosaminyl-diphospho-decaprenol L-rhamnosyltransferase
MARDVSILIVNWNARDPLSRCLRSLTLADTPFQIIVCDNASSDGSADMIAREFPRVRLLRQTENRGFAGGVNLARREATSTRLLLLNPDIEATQAAIDTLADTLDSDAKIGAVGGALINPDGSPQAGFNVRGFPTIGSIAADLLLIDHLWPNNPATRRYLARDLPLSQPADVDQPAAACLMVRASVFDALGGLDERFHPAWFEDVDFCRRLHAAGFRIRYEPRARFVHHGGVAMRTLGLGSFSRIWYHNLALYVCKHDGAATGLLVKALIAAGMLLRLGASGIRGDREAMRAWSSVLRHTLGV